MPVHRHEVQRRGSRTAGAALGGIHSAGGPSFAADLGRGGAAEVRGQGARVVEVIRLEIMKNLDKVRVRQRSLFSAYGIWTSFFFTETPLIALKRCTLAYKFGNK